MLREASRLVSEIHIVAWDVAIIPKGSAIVEGNESFATDVMQYYFSKDEPGIKRKLEEAIECI